MGMEMMTIFATPPKDLGSCRPVRPNAFSPKTVEKGWVLPRRTPPLTIEARFYYAVPQQAGGFSNRGTSEARNVLNPAHFVTRTYRDFKVHRSASPKGVLC